MVYYLIYYYIFLFIYFLGKRGKREPRFPFETPLEKF